uniref:Krueppel-like factor 7 n=1 Tax=Sinocyclocheilus grahami TaxID=75366 RepID=A0A672K5N6_SINGR
MDVLANYSIFQELQLVHDTGYFSAMPSLEENWQQTCLELERYLQTEPKRLSELFDEELDCLLTPAFMKGDSDEDLMDPLLPSLSDEPSPAPLLVSLPKNLHAPANTKNTEAGLKEASGGVNPAQLNAVTSLTPPSSPELGRHLVKDPHIHSLSSLSLATSLTLHPLTSCNLHALPLCFFSILFFPCVFFFIGSFAVQSV